jgi:hypothetical protein
MTSKPESATVVDLKQARDEHMQKEFEKGWLLPDGTRLPPFTLYDPPPPYMVHPCQVIDLPVKAPAEPDKS